MAAKRKRRTAAQKAATRKMIAANRRRLSGGRKPTRRRRRRTSAISFSGIKSRVRRVARRRKGGGGGRRRSVRRVSARGFVGNVLNNQLFPAFTGAAGAVGTDILWGMLPGIPPQFKHGYVRYLGKGLTAVLLGWGVNVLMRNPTTGNALASGGMTVALTDAFREFAVTNEFMKNNLRIGQYMDDEGLGAYYNPAQIMNIQNDSGALPFDESSTVSSYVDQMDVDTEEFADAGY